MLSTGSIPVIRTQKPLNFRGFLCLCCIVVKNDYLHYILDFFGISSGIVIEYLNKKMYFFVYMTKLQWQSVRKRRAVSVKTGFSLKELL